jgi:hypothetical protein
LPTAKAVHAAIVNPLRSAYVRNMTDNQTTRPAAVAAVFKHDRFQHWLVPPFVIPTFLLLLVAAYGIYRAAA